MGYTAIAAKLVELLNTISDFAVVYDHDPDTFEGYPAATVESMSHQDEFYDTAANRRAFTHLIRLYYRTDEDQDAETILRSLTDQVIETVEAHVSVPGIWEIARPSQATWSRGERDVPVRIVEITVNVESRVLR